MTKLHAINPSADIYFNAIPLHKWTLHVHYDATPLYGWRPTTFAESEQAKSLRLNPRIMIPYEFFKANKTIMMDECYIRF